MKISLSWLRELVDVPWDVPDLCRRLAMLGLPVESVTELGGGFEGVIVGEVRAKSPHPKADKLTLVKLWDGSATHDVVCGASNVPAPGGKVLWARPGARLPGGLEIGEKDLRGVRSAGMICSERELGLSESHEGIIVLAGEDAEALPGQTAQDALGLRDTVLEVELTPNRGDCLSHLGLAREIAALTGAGPRGVRVSDCDVEPFVAGGAPDVSSLVSVVIDDATGCPRYTARVIEGLRVAPSPRWMRRRLEAVGVRPISNLVDVTNYVMFELGQPLHAFDLGRVAGPSIRVRRAKAGEKMVTLDGQERALEDKDLLICDAKGPVALAGVMGGAGSEVEDGTTRVLLEAAAFEPSAVRRTARRLGLHSESSHRFERGVDQVAVERASRRAARLFAELGGAGAKVLRGVVDVEPRPRVAVAIDLRPARLEQLMGFAVEPATIRRTLGALGVAVGEEQGRDALSCTPPSHRADLELEVDLIEEVVRLHGYQHIPATLPVTQTSPRPRHGLVEAARDALAAAGLHEAITFGFTSPARLGALRFPEGHPASRTTALINPLREEQSVMRTSLVANLLVALAANQRNGARDVRLFEIGHVFLPSGKTLPDEPTHAAGVMCGERAGWPGSLGGGALDFWDARGVVERLLSALRIPVDFVPARSEEGFLHPGVAAGIVVGGEHVGVVGEVHPVTRDRLGVDGVCFAFELALGKLPAPAVARFTPLERFPAVTRDVSFFVDEHVPAARVRALVAEAGEPLLRELGVLEDYREAGRVPAGKKGMLWSMTYRAADRTLTDAEVDAAHERLVARLLAALPAERR